MDFFGENDAKQMPDHLFAGVSHLDYATAERANIHEQNFVVCPRYWYIDAKIKCLDCGQHFLFSKQEQQYWYEVLKFWIDSFPDRCKKCQKANKLVAGDIDYVCWHHADQQKQQQVNKRVRQIIAAYGFLPHKLWELGVKFDP